MVKAMTPNLRAHLGMGDALDLLQCPVCETFYVPKTTPTGRLIPHCRLPRLKVSVIQGVEYRWLDGEVHVDWAAIEARVVGSLLTGGVVDPPLTGSLLDIEV